MKPPKGKHEKTKYPSLRHAVAREGYNLASDQVERLKSAFPEAFSEGKIHFEKLRATLGDLPDEGQERYSFTWAGKRKAILELQKPTWGTLVPARDESVNFDTTQNVFIGGENLEVLKLLYKSYFGRVKLIYIDPPYNTGSDFVYPDNFADPKDAYLRITGQKDAQGNLLTSNPETSGRYHSAWLSMMYPRLFLARQLLRDDGVIFVSIDDHEVHNLRQMMNEVFGEEGFLATFIWRRRVGSSLAASWVSADHEYVIAYSKNPEAVYVRGDERDMSKYSIPDGKGRFYASMPLTVGMTKAMRPNQWFELKNPKTGTGYWPPEGRVWGFYPPTMQQKIADDKIIWPEDYPDRKLTTPRLKSYAEDSKRERKPISTWIAEKNGNSEVDDDSFVMTSAKNEEGTRVLKSLLGDVGFNYPKPISLLISLVDQFTKEDDLILDFFAGSATTAHAVLEVNRQDGGRRRFVCVQLPEKIGQTATVPGITTIADVGKERIRRVIAKFANKSDGELPLNDPTKAEIGFAVFKLQSSSFKHWNGAQGSDPARLAGEMELFTDPLVEKWNPENVVYEVALREGFALTARLEKLGLVKSNEVWRVTDPEREQTFRICLDDDLKPETLRALGLTKDDLFICRDCALTDKLAANLALQCRLRTI